MSKGHYVLWGLCLSLLCWAGCSNDVTCFNNATPQVQAVWADAVKLDKENSYMEAAETYDHLLHMAINPEQTRAVQTAVGRMYVRMNRAAANGDREAKRIVGMLNENKKAHPVE
jgi:hypothetical protein